MSERLAPVDEFTGLPLPILPKPPDFTEIRKTRLFEEFSRSDNHHAFYPNNSLTTEAQRVLRHSRLQQGTRLLHDKYHQAYDAVNNPQEDKECFNLSILALAGYVPSTAVDTTGPVPVIRTLNQKQRIQMQTQTLFPEARLSKTSGRDINQIARGSFFMKIALSQDFGHIKESMLDEFLESQNAKRRLYLGITILDLAFWRASEGVEHLYKDARKTGLISKSRPRSPVGLLKNVVSGYQPDYFLTLKSTLSSS